VQAMRIDHDPSDMIVAGIVNCRVNFPVA
jgi:hypothetical protein